MDVANLQSGHFVTLLMMAFALGMDAFSLGIGIGLKGIRLRDILKLSSVIALFHVWMPLAGIVAGRYMGVLLGHVATMAAGGLLLVLGGHMIYSSMRGDHARSFNHRSVWGMTLFAFGVSVDSFSVGISLGLFAADMMMTILLFGAFGGLMSVLGLLLGRRVSVNLGDYGEACGGVILLAFGILFLV
ncbi:manganese efflux pump [Paenibacillus cisolokensis]|uniref:Putative manganese efflux pump MntP n=2 Tax=Paenibacillus cisolokensis TaxID=1658519 RepID=A0ABQ4N4T9_9BACL|nr:manganese efflux pump [Paenibacillus cisolokensis]GIQ63175.1 putative manganese efflux pump MntP [Paenibacillus cisolokensis]